MKKIVCLLAVVGVMGGWMPSARAVDLYANAVAASSFANVLSPQNAVGAPDGLYADFMDNDTYIKLDMGEGEEGHDGLLLYVKPLNFGATVRVTFLSADSVVLGTDSTTFAPGATEWTATYYGTEPFRYVKIESTEDETWRLDAVMASAITTPSAEPVPSDEPSAEPVVETPSWSLIKLEDGDTVYFLDSQNIRHPFPNEVTFFSWSYSFDDVATVDATTMASYTLGSSVTVKPGSYLVKIQSVPRVYAVGPNHTLHWITSESLATSLYGAGWANQVIDISDAFWPHYTEGTVILSAEDAELGSETTPF